MHHVILTESEASSYRSVKTTTDKMKTCSRRDLFSDHCFTLKAFAVQLLSEVEKLCLWLDVVSSRKIIQRINKSWDWNFTNWTILLLSQGKYSYIIPLGFKSCLSNAYLLIFKVYTPIQECITSSISLLQPHLVAEKPACVHFTFFSLRGEHKRVGGPDKICICRWKNHKNQTRAQKLLSDLNRN